MEILNELGYPVLLGTSRKSVIGLTLDLPVDAAGRRYDGYDRIWGTEGMCIRTRP